MKEKKNFQATVMFADGRSVDVAISRSILEFLEPFAANVLPILTEGTRLNDVIPNIDNIVAVTRQDHEFLPRISAPERRATFTLGQKDMREAVCDLLRDEAKKVPRPDGFRIYELIDKIEQLEVLNADA